ncbi:MAG: TlpA family protein disulfide reductase [Anaerolineales bacterium]|nr:TlpA family protein disulfide reductase [Anaerolineales bacterium]MCX7608010.1 TlpA family protein disulfide reductase [Anaerolineales bacterium]MDW8226592.1 TlpA disulfide reductase family protein [Anaerolineales bacterium]
MMQPAHHRLIPFFTLLLGLIWIIVSRVDTLPPSAKPEAPQKGFPAPDFTLESREGQLIQLSDLRGRPVLLNFWASWCPPCRAEMPAMQSIYEKYGDYFVLLAINVTNQDTPSNVEAFIREYNLTFPILFDWDGAVARRYGLISLPTTYVIDAEGTIREILVGGPLTEASLLARLETLLGDLP